MGCEDGKIRIFKTENWDLFQELEANAGMNRAIAFDRNDFLSSGSEEGKVLTWRKPETILLD